MDTEPSFADSIQASLAERHASEAWKWFKSVGSPKFWLAPMVGQSECAFRMLVRNYGATMCSTEVTRTFPNQEGRGVE